MQNRKSAKKCRLKKKAEFGQMRGDVMKLQEENKNLKEKVCEATLNLIKKTLLPKHNPLTEKFE
jgi:hypothetical protein